MINLVGASIPRSGHHLLERMLRSVFGPRLHYCEYYNIPDCCRSIPCKTGGFDVVFQKSHDFDFNLPIILSDSVLYIVQYREPIETVLSDRELFCKSNPGSEINRFNYLIFLADHIIYNKRFYKKWITSQMVNSIHVRYEELVGNPVAVIQSILVRMQLSSYVDISSDKVLSNLQVGDDMSKYKKKNYSSYKQFDRNLISQYESIFYREISGVTYPMKFSDILVSTDELDSVLFQREVLLQQMESLQN
ncbi:hypothetical protein C8R30_13711 [Nitrosomonas nitrosa]|uniref:hypothetical protein n=1 Tax=Nitrosomonas nitrosa TaxID=52442 RepID=UPI000D312B76|nr:hypothetical protein [Nitrosomonas nitrosa]PTQ90243.1 hypothetical protein C8R30_13711 [Nitrosomonas nitrosa]